ncbi:MAG TPA: MFS transporter, partial [Spirochaetia bacterium]|nr:MFS transporter [Spirochaetia bacterium]
MSSGAARNRYAFGLGTVGRDMLYTTVSLFLLVYLTEVLDLPDSTMWYMTGALTVLRVFDALNDPVMGLLVDNTRSRYGKFKPWIAIGGLVGGALTVLMFSDLGLRGGGYVASFVIIYLAWDLAYGANDIAYWSMLPVLSLDRRRREEIGSFAKICGSLGAYAVVVGIMPITGAMGGGREAWLAFSV